MNFLVVASGGFPLRRIERCASMALYLEYPPLRISLGSLIIFVVFIVVVRKYSVLQPPYFMTKDVMAGVAQLEQFDEELYKVRRCERYYRRRIISSRAGMDRHVWSGVACRYAALMSKQNAFFFVIRRRSFLWLVVCFSNALEPLM